jgi:hypothetical protein
MPRRVHSSTLLSARAGCDRCAWTVMGANAQGLAAQHHDKKHHPTHVEITTLIRYGSGGSAPRQDEQRSLL